MKILVMLGIVFAFFLVLFVVMLESSRRSMNRMRQPAPCVVQK